MRALAGLVLAALAVSPAAAQPAAATAPPKPEAQAIAPGVWLIPGGILPRRQPDGNTVVFQGPRGLVVMDTGRHAWHRQAILDFAKARRSPVVAIVNSHWHLDHVSGDPALKAAYPHAKLYASRAIDEALTGFLARSAADTGVASSPVRRACRAMVAVVALADTKPPARPVTRRPRRGPRARTAM